MNRPPFPAAHNGRMPRAIDAYRGLAQPSRLRVLDVILTNPGIGLTELSDQTGLHQNTLRDHVRILEDEGFIRSETERTGRRGRPRRLFHAVRPADRNEVADRRLRDALRQGELMRRVMPVAESSLPPEAVRQLDALYTHLDDVGLQPDVDETTLTVELAPCRFHDLLAENAATACRVHEELVRSVLRRAGGPVEVDRFLPFVTAHSCRIHLALRDTATAGE